MHLKITNLILQTYLPAANDFFLNNIPFLDTALWYTKLNFNVLLYTMVYDSMVLSVYAGSVIYSPYETKP